MPELLDAIKAELNRDSSPGRFVITGSTRFDSLPLVSQSLTGRLHRIEVHPLSQGEIESRRESLIETLFDDPAGAVTAQPSTVTRSDYARRIARGGFPLALQRTGAARDRWFDDYLALCLERDLLELGRVRRPGALAPLLSRLAAHTAQILNMSRVGAELELPASTASDYIRLFEQSFLVRLLPAWGKTVRAATASRPKVHIADSGLAARLLRLPPNKLARIDPTSAAAVRASARDVRRRRSAQAGLVDAAPAPCRPLAHPRRRGGRPRHRGRARRRGGRHRGEGQHQGASGRPPRSAETPRRSRERFTAGVVFHTGPHCARYADDERIIALPVDRLWSNT